MLNWASFWRQLGGNFHTDYRPGNPATVRVVRWPSAVDTAGYRLRPPTFTPVSLISIDDKVCCSSRQPICPGVAAQTKFVVGRKSSAVSGGPDVSRTAITDGSG